MRVKEVEESVSSIRKTRERQGAVIDSLKAALARVAAEKLAVFDEIEDRDLLDYLRISMKVRIRCG